jgi:hypothetical protein
MANIMIPYPISPDDDGARVKALQKALLSIVKVSTNPDLGELMNDANFVKKWDKEVKHSVYGRATERAVEVFQKHIMGIAPTGKVNKATAEAINSQLNKGGSSPQPVPPDVKPTVSGIVYDEWIEPMAGAPVMIFDQDIRSEHLLGEGETDTKGNYSITYSKQKLTKQDAGGANIIVKLYGSDGDPVYTSPVNYNAPAQLQADINLGPRAYLGVSEFITNAELIKGFIGHLAIAELTENKKVHDLSFLISKTGIGVNTLLLLVASFRYEKWTGLEAEVYYGILSINKAFVKASGNGLPADPDTTIEQAYVSFWTSPLATMLTALNQAALDNTVTYKLLQKTKEITAALQKLIVAPPQDAGATQSLPPVYTNVQTAGLNAAQQQAFLNLYGTTGISASFWTALAADPSFQGPAGTAAVNKVQAVYQLSGWTYNNTALTAYIMQTYSIGSLQSFSSLVSTTPAEWANIITASGTLTATGAGTTATAAGLGASIAAGIEQMYPSQVFASRISANTTLQLPNSDYITSVLNSQDFNILNTAVVPYLKNYTSSHPLPAGASLQTITYQVMGMQRTYRVTQNSDASVALIAANIYSARQIYTLGKPNFINQFQASLGGEVAAGMIFDQAAQMHAGAVTLMGQVVSRLGNPPTNVFTDYSAQLSTSALAASYPDVAGLFGMAASYCECDDCQSFLGIPAYLADLLDYLSLRITSNPAGSNARAQLLANQYSYPYESQTLTWHRRPDIGDIDLTCDNTNVELPYIDIVNELLEDYVIPPVAILQIPVTSGVDTLQECLAWTTTNIVQGPLGDGTLYNLLIQIGADPKTPICNINLLTPQAVVSAGFYADGENLPAAWTEVSEAEMPGPGSVPVPAFLQWMIRDQFITLKLILDAPGQSIKQQKDAKVLPVEPPNGSLPVPIHPELSTFGLIVQEVHQTHLTAEEISANPEYTNTNVYNSLSDPFNTFNNNLWSLYMSGGMIPLTLPFDLYFTEANLFLQKMGVQRYTVINTFGQQGTPPLSSNVAAYLGLSMGDVNIIFTSRFSPGAAVPDPQVIFWGSALLQQGSNPVYSLPVSLFLTETGLTFEQLQTLMELECINGGNYSQITTNVLCDTTEMRITPVASLQLDCINRFLRLWNKLNLQTTISMHELDLCITAFGQGSIDTDFAGSLYYFLQLMNQMGLTASQALALYADIDGSLYSNNSAAYNSLYQQLFQNRQINNPLIAAFNLPIPPTSGGSSSLISNTQVNPGVIPAILTACGITKADLATIISMSPAAANLTADSLSFMYACGLLSNFLSISVSDLYTFSILAGINPINNPLSTLGTLPATPPAPPPAPLGATPADTFAFITKYNEIQQAGFTVDELNYILCNQSTATPSLIPTSSTILTGLGTIRAALQAAVSATTVVPDPNGTLLKTWLADPDLNWDKTVAAKVLSILATAGSAAYTAQVQNNLRLLQLLNVQYAVSGATVYLEQLPAISFPPASDIAYLHYDPTNTYFFYSGNMSSQEQVTLTTIINDATFTPVITQLQQQSQICPLSAAILPAAPLTTIPTTFVTAQQSVPGFSFGRGALRFEGVMTATVYSALLAQSDDPTYGCALTQLFIASQSAAAAATTYVQLAALPAIALPDDAVSGLTYDATAKELSFTGAMSAADCLALLGLAPDVTWQMAVCSLYATAAAGQTVSATLNALPGTLTPFPDLSGLDNFSFSPGVLTFSGTMTSTQLGTLSGSQTDPAYINYNNAVHLLYTLSQGGGNVSVPLTALPDGFALPPITGLLYSPPALCFAGQMDAAVESALSNLSADPGWNAAITSLAANAPAGVIAAVQLTLATDPTAAINALGISGISCAADAGGSVIISMTVQPSAADQKNLLAVSSDPVYVEGMGYLLAQTSAIVPAALPAVVVPLPDFTISSGVSYQPGTIVFSGSPVSTCMDEFNLSQLSSQPDYLAAIGWIYSELPPSVPSTTPPTPCYGAILAALPPVTLPTSLPSGSTISWSAGLLSFVGQMQQADLAAIQALSPDFSNTATAACQALNALNAASQIFSQAFLNLTVLPNGVTSANLLANNVSCQPSLNGFVLTYPYAISESATRSGLMSSAIQEALIALSAAADPTYVTAINSLYTQSQTKVQVSVPLASLPAIVPPSSTQTNFDGTNGVLYYYGDLSDLPATITSLSALSPDPAYNAALSSLAQFTSNPGNYSYMIYAPPPQSPFPPLGLKLTSGTINYVGGTIGCTGVLSFADYQGLLALSDDPDYIAAISYLYVHSQAGGSVTTDTYLGLPSISIPAIYSNQLSYLPATGTLSLQGYISNPDLPVLLSLSADPAYQAAIHSLYSAVNTVPAPLFPNLYEALWPAADGGMVPPAVADLYEYFLTAINPIYQPIKEAEALEAQISTLFNITPAVADVLVDQVPDLFADFTATSFVGTSKPINPDPDQFPLAKWWLILARASFLVNNFNLSAADTEWLLENNQALPAVNINALALTAYPNPAVSSTFLPFSNWEVLNNLCLFQKSYNPVTMVDPTDPASTVSLSVYTLISEAQALDASLGATPDPGTFLAQVNLLTGWNMNELLYLLSIGQASPPTNLITVVLNPLSLTDTGNPAVGCAPSLSSITALLELSSCFALATRLKAVPSRCITWCVDPITNTAALDIKQALKSLYPDDTSWMSAIQPLMNTLRQNRRDAVLAYLLSNPVDNVFGNFDAFPDEYHAYGNFLIDLEMSSCQPTTRVIQAYCSVQLFAQRCLMNMEPSITVDTSKDDGWQQWSWMGTYETWYQARSLLLYPENYIVPETLPNQSPFFADMQNDLTQGPVTTDIVEAAFDNYLESLDGVARLEVKGMWFDEPTGTLHVFACTYGGNPANYYYRTQNSSQVWSPWEPVTVDIEAEVIIPVVQNGRIYLYWPVFTQTTDEDKKAQTQSANTNSSGSTSMSAPPPPKYWQIQMAFSEYKNGQWTGKKVTKDYLSSSNIIIDSESLIIYPDTTDFVFFPLDVPQSNNNGYQGTINSLDSNNSIAIACYQNVPEKISISIAVTLDFIIGTYEYSGSGSSVTQTTNTTNFVPPPFNFTITVNPPATTFNIQTLLTKIVDTHKITYFDQPENISGQPFIPDGGGNFYIDLQSSQTIDITNAPGPTIQSILNTLFAASSGVSAYGTYTITAQVSTTISIGSTVDSLSILPGTQNSFLLDPARGYPSPIDLGTLCKYTKQVNKFWFGYSNLENMLAVGDWNLYFPSNTTPILNIQYNPQKISIAYNNLLSFQMSWYTKYAFFEEGQVDLNKIGMMMPFFYQDASCTFFASPALPFLNSWVYYSNVEALIQADKTGSVIGLFYDAIKSSANPFYYEFDNFYHPFAHEFIKIAAQNPVDYILTRAIQLTGDPTYGDKPEVSGNLINSNPYYTPLNFANTYLPKLVIGGGSGDPDYPIDQMDFGTEFTLMGQNSSYGQYNWELFFHCVLMSGIALSQNQQFEDADNCFKLIFNPTDTSGYPGPQKFWVTKPFFENNAATQTIDEIILSYVQDPSNQQAFWKSVNAWRSDPGDPHMLAQMRVTPYMYVTFMRYLDNRMAWANYNFQQATMESVNIAIQIYMSILDNLGSEPEAIPALEGADVMNYYQMEFYMADQMAAEDTSTLTGYISDPFVQFENMVPPPSPDPYAQNPSQNIPTLSGLYFCIPPNSVLLAYWSAVNTQLTKIRNCLNIAGQFQPLSPFPSVPGLNNMDSSSISDWGGVLPNYRFTVMVQKAAELCNEVKSLGAALLAALEKKDAEGLALLRANQEVSVQQAVDLIKQLQITDANLGLQNLQNYQSLVGDKITYYSGLIQAGLLGLETQALTLNQSSLALEDPVTQAALLAGQLKLLPNLSIGIDGFGGSPSANVSFGGEQMAGIAEMQVTYLSYLAHCSDKSAALANTNASYARRAAEWQFQLTLANDELTQVNTQIEAAQNKITMATQDEQNQQLLIQNAENISAYLTDKYTNQQLYTWMVTQLSNVYFQSYQLAYSVAKQAEICFRYELGITDTSYINYGYWDSLHKGLLSGENLMSSIRQMETDYLNLNVREYELTRQISLTQLDPVALLQLKTSGTCFINIPEELFDMDYPGHYFRRVKHIAVTLPGVVGPYTPVCLTMTLMSNSVRIDNTAGTAGNYPRNTDSSGAPTNDSRFLDNVAPIQYIATSNGVNDSGLFELNLRDERYLPFERAGAISTWQLEFPSVYPQFDPATITDLIIHFGYTSRDGGAALQSAATQSVQNKLKSAMTAPGLVLMRGFSARRDFPTQWYKFLNPANPGDTQQLVLDITQRFPFFTNGLTIKITRVALVADMPATVSTAGPDSPLANLYLSGVKLSNALLQFGTDPDFSSSYPGADNIQYSMVSCKDGVGTWTITNGTGGGGSTTVLTNAEINDLSAIFYYSLVNNS